MIVLLEVDPNLVRPGWTPLIVVVLLGIVLFFLGRSMLKQFRKIDVPADHDPAGAEDPSAAPRVTDERTVTAGGERPPIPDLRTRKVEGSADSPPPDRR